MQTPYTTFMADVHRRCAEALAAYNAAKGRKDKRAALAELREAEQACERRYQEWQAEV